MYPFSIRVCNTGANCKYICFSFIVYHRSGRLIFFACFTLYNVMAFKKWLYGLSFSNCLCHVMTYNCLSLYEIWTLSCLIDNHFKSFKIILYCKKHMYHLWICQFLTYVVRSNSYTWRFERHSGFLKILK